MTIFTKLTKQLKKIEYLKTSFGFINSDLIIETEFNHYALNFSCISKNDHIKHHYKQSSFQENLEYIAKTHKNVTPDLLTLSVRLKNTKIRNAEIKVLLMEAICEAFKIHFPNTNELKKMRSIQTKQQKKIRETQIKLLQTNQVKAFNLLTTKDHENAKHYKNSDLTGITAIKLNLSYLNFQKTIFNKANLTGANLSHSNLKEAKFNACDLTQADLSNAILLGVDFRNTNMTEINLTGCHYNHETLFPKTFTIPKKMVWKGKETFIKADPSTDMDMKGFMAKLNKTVDNARISKALSMLKKSKFQLYLQVSNNEVVGVIKSQSDHSLVYSCRISRQGHFSCCTQNLNTCGGLRGRVCKHILVLVIGLAQNKEIKFSQLYQWINNSSSYKPTLNRNKMSEILLKYKGAEAGEIDWRPSETIPEDYYLF